MVEVLKSVLSAAAIEYLVFLERDEALTQFELVASNPWKMLKLFARTVINLVHNLPDCLDDEEAFLEELPFDAVNVHVYRCDLAVNMAVRCHCRVGFLVMHVGERTIADPCKQHHLVRW